ncbi:MAG: cytochrome c oxidase subunit II [Pyrinomonadaceae bacterium]
MMAFALQFQQFMPTQASTYAWQVDGLFFYLVLLTVLFGTIISGTIIYFAVKYRRRSPSELPPPVAGSHKLEIGVTTVLLLLSMTIFVWGAAIFLEQTRLPKDGLEISVVGKQWMWKFEHPTGQREINELHVPVGTKVKLTMATEDVIHALYVPDFRMQYQVVPGRYTNAWFEATKTGKYHLYCNMYCGTNHSGMGGWVYVMEPGDYQAWLSGNANQVSPVVAGQNNFQQLGCTSCHGANAEGGRCPPLIGVFGSQQRLQGGSSVLADQTYIRESILNPSAKIVAGYPNIMPTYQGQVSEEQLLQLIAYVKSLSPQNTSGISTTAPARSNNPRTGVASPEGQNAVSPDAQKANPVIAPQSNEGGSNDSTGGNGDSSSGSNGGSATTNSQRGSRTSPQR